MADEDKDAKTEDATPKRLDEAREKGQVAMSTEFIASVMLLGTIGAFLVFGGYLGNAAGRAIVDGLMNASRLALVELAPVDFAALMGDSAQKLAMAVVILVSPVLMIGFVAAYGQAGIGIATKAVSIDPSKLDPIKGSQKIFGSRGAVRTGLGVLKIAAIMGTVAYITFMQIPALSVVAGTDATMTVAAIGRLLLRVASSAVIVIIALSLIDFVYQRYQHAKEMKMSKQEIKDENKNSEGDPQVKARIRQVQREMASQRMMQDVPDATVVVTNPTHFAVALRYEDGRDAAPTVVAKGLDHVALKIREIAKENRVAVVEQPPLARALHRSCEIGGTVPEDLFEAVAKVLAYVYRSEGRAVGAGS